MGIVSKRTVGDAVRVWYLLPFYKKDRTDVEKQLIMAQYYKAMMRNFVSEDEFNYAKQRVVEHLTRFPLPADLLNFVGEYRNTKHCNQKALPMPECSPEQADKNSKKVGLLRRLSRSLRWNDRGTRIEFAGLIESVSEQMAKCDMSKFEELVDVCEIARKEYVSGRVTLEKYISYVTGGFENGI